MLLFYQLQRSSLSASEDKCNLWNRRICLSHLADSVMKGGCLSALLGVCLFLAAISFVSSLSYTSHFVTYNKEVVYYEHQCYYYYCGWSCYGWYWGWYWYWGWRGCYYSYNCYACSVVRRTRMESAQKCADLWTGPNCNIPYCTTACPKGQTCIEGNTCRCLSAGGTSCKAEGCSSPRKSCYPGTCEGGNRCNCPPQFTGDNCLTIGQTPEISECRVKLFSGNPEIEVAVANCAVEGHDPEITWVGKNAFSRIEAWWQAKDLYPFDPVPPSETNHIRDAKFGIGTTKAKVILSPEGSNRIDKDITPICKDGSKSNPEAHVNCPSRTIKWEELGRSMLADNSTMEVHVLAQLGGYKKLKEGNVREKFYASNTTERRVLFKVDATPPLHGRIVNKSSQDPVISIEKDAIQNPVANFKFSGWYDTVSRINRYEVEIYELLKSSSSGETILIKPQKFKHRDNITNGETFQYTFSSPGVYSVEVTVYDEAKNSARARKIIFYDNENRLKTTKEPLKVDEASEESGYKWITDERLLRNRGEGECALTISWTGRYVNQKHIDEGWLSRVDPWKFQDGIDDKIENSGNRTIHKIEHANGTVGYRLAFKVDQEGGIGLDPKSFTENTNLTDADDLPEATWTTLRSNIVKQKLVMQRLTPNDTVVIWMQAFDVVGHYIEDKIFVRFDSSAPELDSNDPVVLKENTPDQYSSSIEIKAKDPQSGIAEVRYYIRHASLNVNITEGTAKAEKLSETSRRKRTLATCQRGSTDCYCINGGECFANLIVISIDHCVIDRYYDDGTAMQLQYVVVNQAGKSIKAKQPFPMVFPSGKPKCRPIAVITAGTIIAIVIGLLVLLVLIVLVIFMILRWKQDKHPIPDRVRTLASSMRQRVTNKEKVHSSDGRVIYRAKTRRGRVTDDEDDIYVDGSDPGGWRVNRDQLELAETLAEGKFATVKKAYLKKGGETKTVAAKYLPVGASESDKSLLKAKIAFHGNKVPPHDNVVRLIGVIDDGPIMLLEFCDLTLKEWLGKVGKVTTDVLENLLNFTSHIASGMEHLHSNSIVHRRLALRNILLKKDGMNGLVAKLIGFGTFNETASEDQAEESTANVALPLKWLAPETLESVGKGKAVYTQKSDMWAYGVTIWEIYSMGATPYQGKKSSDVEALLKSGYRMPRPDECPPELFDTVVSPCWNVVAKKRPDFKIICKMIRNFRSGGDHQEGYYSVDPTSKKYDNPKERTSDYNAARKAAPHDEIYDDTRK